MLFLWRGLSYILLLVEETYCLEDIANDKIKVSNKSDLLLEQNLNLFNYEKWFFFKFKFEIFMKKRILRILIRRSEFYSFSVLSFLVQDQEISSKIHLTYSGPWLHNMQFQNVHTELVFGTTNKKKWYLTYLIRAFLLLQMVK